MARDDDVAERVWAETGRLVAVAPSTESDLRRLQAGLGLAAAKLPGGPVRKAWFPLREDAPRATDPLEVASFNAMAAAIDGGAGGSHAGAALPGVVALVKLTATNKPDAPEGGVPNWLTAAIDSGASPAAIFGVRGDRSGRRFGVYERLAAAGAGEYPLFSGVTGTGTLPPEPRGTLGSKAGWLLVVLSFAIGLASIVMIWSQGAQMRRTYAILNGSDRAGYADLLARHPCTADAGIAALCHDASAIPDKADLGCLTEVPAPAAPPPPANQASLPFQGDPPHAARFSATPACYQVWQAARAVEIANSRVRLARSLPSILAVPIGRIAVPDAELPIMFWPLVGLFAGIVALGGAVGLGAYGRLFGLWINGQNRFSLSTAQVSLWTALVIAPFGAITLLHAGMGLSGDTSPDVPGLMFALMGITIGSTALSKYILAVKSASTDGRHDDGFKRFIASSEEGLARNNSPRQAKVLDFFLGEEETNHNQIDVSRFQNVVFTLVLGTSYFASIVAMFEQVSVNAVLGAYAKPQRLFSELPAITGSFLGLLLVSHAAYLTVKAARKDNTGSGGAGRD